jgi:hypothetical protein
MSLDEAKVLVQSAKSNKDSEELHLNHEEFKELIFSKDESLNVNLKVLKPTSPSEAIKIFENHEGEIQT